MDYLDNGKNLNGFKKLGIVGILILSNKILPKQYRAFGKLPLKAEIYVIKKLFQSFFKNEKT